jgi:thiol-disulfide isomerase/thioredoxin
MYRWLLFLAIVLSAPLIALPAEKSYSCQAPTDIQTEINKAGSRGIDELLLKNPGDFWIRLAYIDSKSGSPQLRGNSGVPSSPASDDVIDRFRKESENLSEDPEAAYLYAYSIIHKNTAKSVEILTGLTNSVPSFTRPWLSLAAIYTYPAFSDLAKMRQYTEKYLALCPNTLESRIATSAQQLARSDTLLAYARTLREQVAGKENEQTLSLYAPLWQLESKLARPAEQAEYRKLLENDLKFLEGLDKVKYRIAEPMLTQGYQILGKGGTDFDMSSFTSFMKAQTEWQAANPRPEAGADPEARAEYYKKQLQFANQWLEKLPDNSSVITFWFNAVSSQPDVSDESLIRDGNKALAVLNKSGFISTSALDVLRIWAFRGLELDRVRDLVQQVLRQQIPFTPSIMQQSDLYGDYMTLMNEDMRWRTNTRSWGILVTTYVKTSQLDKARDLLNEWEKALDARRSKAKEISERQFLQSRNAAAPGSSNTINVMRAMETSIVSGIRTDEARYNEASAQLAAAEDRTVDALALYQSSLRMMYAIPASGSDLGSIENLKEADRLWKKLGGSQAGWKVWVDSLKPIQTLRLPSGPQWSGMNRGIPQFSVLDQNGKTWTPDSFKGKTTLVNIWATWCGPCKAELPLVQELYEKNKDRGDIQVITLNVDSEQNLVEPFLKENKYSFPSLFAKSFMDSFAGPIGIPLTWIVDSSGTIRNETVGYSTSNTDWVSQTLARMEDVKSAAKSK